MSNEGGLIMSNEKGSRTFCIKCEEKLIKSEHSKFLIYRFGDGSLLCNNKECHEYRVIVCYYQEEE